MTSEQCACRQAKRENLVQELIKALEVIVDRFGPCEHDYVFSKRMALRTARAVLARAKEQE